MWSLTCHLGRTQLQALVPKQGTRPWQWGRLQTEVWTGVTSILLFYVSIQEYFQTVRIHLEQGARCFKTVLERWVWRNWREGRYFCQKTKNSEERDSYIKKKIKFKEVLGEMAEDVNVTLARRNETCSVQCLSQLPGTGQVPGDSKKSCLPSYWHFPLIFAEAKLEDQIQQKCVVLSGDGF